VHSEQNHSIDVLLTRVFSILFWFNPVIWLYQKAILKIWIHRDSEALLKISDKSVSNHAFKITAHENCVALSIILSIINQKTNHHVKQKNNQKNQFMEIRL
jgi:beta-lactamase regulating signal transducer with metallopeptidase domain